MSKPSALGAVLYSPETTFAETDTDAVATRLEVATRVDVSGLTRDTIEAPYTSQMAGGGYRTVLGPKGGSFTIELYLTGHGTDPAAGALTETDLYTLLKYVLGAGSSSNDGGEAAGTGSATSIDHTGATVGAYTGLLVGAVGDGRGNGQFYLAESEAAGTIALHNGMEAAANASDAIRPALSVAPVSLASSLTDVTSLRFLLQTGDRQYLCRGCYCTDVSVSGLALRETPRVSLTFATALWETSSATFPSAVTSDAKTPAPVSGGSFYLSDSTTRATYCVRDFSVSFEHTLHVIESPCTDSTEQVVASVKYGGTQATIQATLDYAAALFTHYDSEDELRLCYTLSAAPGRAVGLYFPKLVFTAKPSQVDSNGLNAVQVALRAKPNESGATDLAAAPFHIFMG